MKSSNATLPAHESSFASPAWSLAFTNARIALPIVQVMVQVLLLVQVQVQVAFISVVDGINQRGA